MAEDAEPLGRRDRPAKALLSSAVIVDAALELVARDGLDAVTLRRVADRLDTGPASLYVYISNREQLLERMLDRALAEVGEVVVKHKRWRRRLVELFEEVLDALDRYPGIGQVALGVTPEGPAAEAIAGNARELMHAGGVDSQTAAWACDNLFLFTAATAVRHAAARGKRSESEPSSGDERFAFGVNALTRAAARDALPSA